jgi:hypothetical protein
MKVHLCGSTKILNIIQIIMLLNHLLIPLSILIKISEGSVSQDAVIFCLIRSYRIREENFNWNKGFPPVYCGLFYHSKYNY